MRKIVIFWLFLSTLALVSVSAETWEQYLKRVNSMSNVVIKANHSYSDNSSDDSIGAIWATHEWCSAAYLNISNNYPGLSQQAKTVCLLMSAAHRADVDRYEQIIYQYSTSRFNNIRGRYNYWLKHLNDGGTIVFN